MGKLKHSHTYREKHECHDGRKHTHTHGNNEKIKRKREITSIYKYMFVKIFFTVNMFISIDYEVMINYVKEKISLHTLSKQTGKVYLKKQTKKSNKLKQATK